MHRQGILQERDQPRVLARPRPRRHVRHSQGPPVPAGSRNPERRASSAASRNAVRASSRLPARARTSPRARRVSIRTSSSGASADVEHRECLPIQPGSLFERQGSRGRVTGPPRDRRWPRGPCGHVVTDARGSTPRRGPPRPSGMRARRGACRWRSIDLLEDARDTSDGASLASPSTTRHRAFHARHRARSGTDRATPATGRSRPAATDSSTRSRARSGSTVCDSAQDLEVEFGAEDGRHRRADRRCPHGDVRSVER